MAYVFHMVCSTIIHGERGLGEPSRKSPSLDSTRERWSRNLVECWAHRIISQAFGRWNPVSTLMMVVFFIQEKLTRRSPWSTSITTILFIVRGEVRIERSLPSPFVAQLPLQMINLQLHVLSIFLVTGVTPSSRLTSTSMGGMHTTFPILSSFKMKEMILMSRAHRFPLVWTWTYHNWPLYSLSHKNFPQTVPIVGTSFRS